MPGPITPELSIYARSGAIVLRNHQSRWLWVPGFAGTTWGVSLLLDPGVRDQLFPDHELLLQEFLEFLRRPGKGFHAALAKLLLDLGPIDDLLDFAVELQHDILRQVGRAEIALP